MSSTLKAANGRIVTSLLAIIAFGLPPLVFAQPTATHTGAPTVSSIPATGTCLVSGRVSGRRSRIVIEGGRRRTVHLRHVVLRSTGSQFIRVTLDEHGFVARRVPAGRTYRLTTANFPSVPRERTFVCGPGTRHTGMDFEITGESLID
jgi:hypothetical protein